MNIRKDSSIETLEFAVYGGICGLLGLISVVILIMSVFECRPALLNAIGISIVSVSLSLLTIHFGRRSDTKQGKLVVIIGIIVLILVVLSYIFGIIPCAIM